MTASVDPVMLVLLLTACIGRGPGTLRRRTI
jgi:hypothetical protein